MIFVITIGAWDAPEFATDTTILDDGSQLTFAPNRRREALYTAAARASEVVEIGPVKPNRLRLRELLRLAVADQLVRADDDGKSGTQLKTAIGEHRARLASLEV